MKRSSLYVLVFSLLSAWAQAATYHMNPSGNDAYPGTDSQPWRTFARAWKSVVPGDTLILQDGVYYDSIEPPRGGKAGAPITIRALNDGKAVVDGEHIRTPILLASYRYADYFVIEGIIARNGTMPPKPQIVVEIQTDYNILRRVTAYNGQRDENTSVIHLGQSANNNLIEDCVAAGYGRKMFEVFKGTHNILRRCFAYWRAWDGRMSCQDWPNGGNIHLYNASYNTVENCVAAGPIGKTSMSVHANASSASAIGNKVLGTISINGGMNPDGTVIKWPTTRPVPTECDPYKVINFVDWHNHRAGFGFKGQGDAQVRDNLYQDILAVGNASYGFTVLKSNNFTGNRIDHATIWGNGLDVKKGGGPGADIIMDEDMAPIAITNSNIKNVRDSMGRALPSIQGEGARLRHRYVDGVLMDGTNGSPAQALWPWPMEQRIREELGISVTNLVAAIIPEQVEPVPLDTQPAFQTSPLYTTFGDKNPYKQFLTLANLSPTAGFRILGYALSGADASAFRITSGSTCPATPFTLGPSQSCKLEITFQASDTIPKWADLSIVSPDAAPYPFPPVLTLHGIGGSSTTTNPPTAPTGLRVVGVSPNN